MAIIKRLCHVATQKRAFKDCVLKMIGAHKSQNNKMNHHAFYVSDTW